MTIIVGMVDRSENDMHNGPRVLIGGDSAGVRSDLTLRRRSDCKVFTRGDKDEWVFGFTTSFRMGQLLRYSLDLPKFYPGDDLMQFMVTQFMDAVRKCLKDGGASAKEHDRESGCEFLVGFRGELFHIYTDYQVGRPVLDFDATGCAETVALGAMMATAGKPARERLTIAMTAAETYSGGVRAPFTIVEGAKL